MSCVVVSRSSPPTFHVFAKAMRSFRDPIALAGLWMDHDAGGVLTVAVTSAPDEVERYLKGLVQYPEALRVVSARHSLRALNDVAETLVTAQGENATYFDGIRVDERANVIVVVTPQPLDQVRGWVEAKVGGEAPVQFVAASIEAVGTQFNNSPPLRGGQAMNSTAGTSCTSGFAVRGAEGLAVLTAGHCAQRGDVWDQIGTFVGITDLSDVTGTDALRVPVKTNVLTNEVTLWFTPTLATEARYRTISSSQLPSNDVVGQISCITGQNFADLRCGEILTRSYAVGIPLDDGRFLSYSTGREIRVDCNPGDSGGPALSGTQARGLISVKVRKAFNDTCVYVHIQHAMNQVGVQAVLTDGPVLGT